MGGFLTFIAFVFLAFVGFVIYFIFKQIQFVIQAIDLYKDMVLRLDKIIEILCAGSAASANISPLPPSRKLSPTEPEAPPKSGYPDQPPSDTEISQMMARSLSKLGYSVEEIASKLQNHGVESAQAMAIAKSVK